MMFRSNEPRGGRTMKFWSLVAIAAGSVLTSGQAFAQQLEKVPMLIFGPPSLGAFLPPVIKARKFDAKHGMDIVFTERPPDAYLVQFNTGESPLGGSAALLNVGLAAEKGVKVVYLFNVFNYWSYVVTSRPDVKTLKDLEGKEMAAAKSTSAYRIMTWFAKQQGVDMDKVAVVNTAPPGLASYIMADRAAAVHMWDPGYDLLKARKPEIRTLDLKIAEAWKNFTGGTAIPYLGVAAHTSWVEKNRHLIPKLFNTYKDAAEWTLANPDEASTIIIDKATPEAQKGVAQLIRSKERLGMRVQWPSEVQKDMLSIYKVGIDVGLMTSDPGPQTLYSGPKQ
jgi:ABC-type nitrate/sulfonate/bicarbonate transport system substrate-binding protein